MEMKFRNSKTMNLFATVFASGIIVILALFGMILSAVFKETANNLSILKIFGYILSGIWIIYLINSFLFYKTVIVTEQQVILKKRKKVLWILEKNDIQECIYQSLSAGNFISPNANSMFFKLKNTKSFAQRKIGKGFYLDNYISLSLKNAKKMIDLGYNVKICSIKNTNKDV